MAADSGRTDGSTRRAESAASTRDAVVACVGRGCNMVEDVAATLALTPNAVRFHLAALERDGIVRRDGVTRTGGVGKPRDVYVLTESAEERRSRAYAPVLAAVVQEAARRLDPAELAPLLATAGASLVADVPRPARATERVRRAAAVLEELGAVLDVVRTRDSVVLRGHGCPLGAVVAEQPATCLVIAGMLSELTGVPVREECDHGPRPSCRFRLPRA